MYYNYEKYVIRNSTDISYKFNINNRNLIIEEFKNETSMDKYVLINNILSFSVDIDENDKIHIAYITTKGQLNYIVFKEESSERNIINVKNNLLIKSLKIKVLYSKVNVFYILYDLEKKVNYLYHINFNNNNFIKEIVEEIDCFKYNNSYFIDYYDEYLYLLYCKNHHTGEYKIRRYNVNDNYCDYFKDRIIKKDISNLNFIITFNNTAIIYFNKLISNNIQTIINYKDFNVKNSQWSSDINISPNDKNTFKPKIFCGEDSIYAIWKQGNSIVYKKSNNIVDWSKEYSEKIKNENIYDALYLSNNFNDVKYKYNHTYMMSIRPFYFYIDVNTKLGFDKDSLYVDSNFILREASITLKDSAGAKKRRSNTNIITDHVEKFKDEAIEGLKTINSNLLKRIVNLSNLVDEKNNIIIDANKKMEELKEVLKRNREEHIYIISKMNKEIEEIEQLIRTNKEEYDIKLKDIVENKNRLIYYSYIINSKSINEIEKLKNSIKEYEDKIQEISNEKILDHKWYRRNINKYENTIIELKEEKDKIVTDLNSKILTLLKLLDEKKIIIEEQRTLIEMKKLKSSN